MLIAACASVLFAPTAWAKSCADFDSQAEAQRYLRSHPQDEDRLDPDNNGIACENAPSPHDNEPVRHQTSTGQTIPLTQDSPTTRPAGGTTTTLLNEDATTTTRDAASTTAATNRDTTNETVSVNQEGDDAGASTAGVVAVVVGVVLFAAAYIWFRRR